LLFTIRRQKEDEADRVLEWLKREINDTWEKRMEITPCYESTPKPKIIEIVKLLPKTNCRDCGQSTCMVFSALLAEGAKGVEDCPQLDEENKIKLEEYLNKFKL